MTAHSFIARRGTAAALGADRFIITTRDAVVEVDSYLARLWETFDRFRTVDEQAQALRQRRWETDETLAESMRELEEAGLLLRADRLAARLREGPAAAASQPRVAAWLTRGRPHLLARSVTSLVAACGAESPELRVFDDTPGGSNGKRLAAELSRAGASEAEVRALRWADRAAAAKYRDELAARSGVALEIVSFALDGLDDATWRDGAARNVVLLSAAGRPFVLSDDDTIFGLRRPERCDETRWRITSRFDPLEPRFPPDPASIRALPAAPVNPLQAHGRLLGRTVAGCFGIGETDVSDASSELVEVLLAGGARVAVTMAGIAGHSVSENARMAFGLRGEARDAAITSAEDYSRVRVAREYVRAVREWTLSSGELLVAPNIGLDAGQMLPPFMPVGRNAEGVFSMVLRRTSPAALVGHLPYAVLHDPGPLPPFDEGSLHDLRLRITDLATLLLVYAPRLFGDDPAARLAQLGPYLTAVASQPAADFERYMVELWMRHMSEHVAFLEELLAWYHREPQEWASDVETHIERVAEHAMSAAPVSPRDLPGTPEESLATARRCIRLYGELLVAWPQLREAAKHAEVPLFAPLVT